MDNSKYYNEKAKEIRKLRQDVPYIFARVGLREFDENFRKKSFFGQPWPGSPTVPRSRLLVKTGRLRRSLDFLIRGMKIIFTSDAPYAEKHNEGFSGTEKVQAHTVKSHKRKMRTKNGVQRVRISQHERSAHTRQTNIPQRKFVDKSKQLYQIFDQSIIDELKRILQ